MRIVLFEIEDWERDAFRSLEDDHEVRYVEAPLSQENVDRYADAEAVSTFIYSKIRAEVLGRLEHLRCIATRSTGFDHIDTEACRQRDIAIANVPTYGENTVAEHVFALLLAISHRIVPAVDRTRRGDFSHAGLEGFDLAGRTLGVVGTGNIGRHTARIGVGFGMEVVAFDVKPDEEAARSTGFRYVDLEELLEAADVVSLHVPGSEATRDLLGEDELSRMKPGSVLINTARGSVVNIRALLQALSSGPLAAAGIDVLPEEPAIREEAELLRRFFSREHDLDTLLADHVLLRLNNVVITPHSAFKTREAIGRILDTTRENLEAYAAGEPRNVVEL